jgi:multidrug efflux pump subunit AcrB
VLDHQTLTLVVALITVALTAILYIVIPKGLFPVQDVGVIQGISVADNSVSYAAMVRRQSALADAILKDPDVVSLTSYVGIDGTNPTLNNGRCPDQSAPARRPLAHGRRNRPPHPAGSRRRARHPPLSATRAGSDARHVDLAQPVQLRAARAEPAGLRSDTCPH